MWSSLKRFWLFDDPRSYGARALLCGAVEGLEAVGKQVRIFSLDPQAPAGAEALRNDLLRFAPDAVLLANHPSSLFLRDIGLTAAPCRFFVWIFDDPFLMGEESFSPDDIVLVADPMFAEAARARGARRVLFLPVAAPVHIQADLRREYAAPLAYVGSTQQMNHRRAQMPEEIVRYFDQIVEYKVSDPARGFEDLLESFPMASGKKIILNGGVAYYLYTEANRLSRLRYLRPLASLGLSLYGNETWSAQIQGTDLQSCFRGALDPFLEYPSLIRSAAININLRSLQGYVAPTQRDFLVPCVGGFLLSTTVKNADFYWNRVDPDNLFYLSAFPWSFAASSPDDLHQAADRFLKEPNARREWTDFAARIIAEKHTFAHRMEQLGRLLDTFYVAENAIV